VAVGRRMVVPCGGTLRLIEHWHRERASVRARQGKVGGNWSEGAEKMARNTPTKVRLARDTRAGAPLAPIPVPVMNSVARGAAEREAYNTVQQGGVARLRKIDVYRRVRAAVLAHLAEAGGGAPLEPGDYERCLSAAYDHYCATLRFLLDERNPPAARAPSPFHALP
jgi:hypothetical protein